MAISTLSSIAALLAVALIRDTPVDIGNGIMPLWAVFLVFVGIVLIFGLLYARQHRRIEPGEWQAQHPSERRRRRADESATPILIDVRDSVAEPVEEIQINLEDQPEVRTD